MLADDLFRKNANSVLSPVLTDTNLTRTWKAAQRIQVNCVIQQIFHLNQTRIPLPVPDEMRKYGGRVSALPP